MKTAQPLQLIQVEEEYHEIFQGDVKVGNANLFIYPDSITIDNIEFAQDHQYQGYGRQIVEQLKNMPGISSLTGDSVPEAMPFWLKMGAVFNGSELDRMEETGHALVGFKIAWAR